MMHRVLQALARFARNEKGVTTLEYGILAAGVAVVIGIIVAEDGVFQQTIEELFNRVIDSLPTVSGGGSGS